MTLWRCQECGWRGDEEEIISFADPVLEGNSWNICPECRAAEQFDNMCDEPECRKVATCGWPSPEGYRRTCFEHSSFAAAKRHA
jgi:hypothetical protein